MGMHGFCRVQRDTGGCPGHGAEANPPGHPKGSSVPEGGRQVNARSQGIREITTAPSHDGMPPATCQVESSTTGVRSLESRESKGSKADRGQRRELWGGQRLQSRKGPRRMA